MLSTSVSTPPIPEPKATPRRGASSGVTSRRASARAWAATATANCAKRSARRTSLRSMWSGGSKSRTSPAIVVSRPVASKRVIGPMPLLPATMPSHVFCTEDPRGLIMPMPVTTTRRRSRSRTWSSVLAVLDRLQRGDLRRFYQSGSGEERKRDRDERQLESRETDVTQVADPHEITIGQPPLTPERRVRENRRENDVRKQLRDAGM